MGEEFYVNLMETYMASKLITIQGKVANYVSEVINWIYGLLDHDIKASTDRDCASGAWLASKLCPSNSVPWAITKAKILCSDLTAEARIWMSIFKMLDSLSLIFPYVILELCKRAKVQMLPGDTCMEPKIMIVPLKMCGEGSVVKIKMWKMDYGKSMRVEDDSPIPSSMVLLRH
ncbi:hypothetical protein RDI58_022263 [Solanum bulbocastanum]|uniref:Uncharacterized protein n=1 Tax=Solanum bulbocastanum TaxID=147425 RepID=A0AAN8T5G6_SOLBU